ncbi:hypothetical protein [Cerasicoccus fimbriatus]|uniref:hypothetical protein n=1 Tax=Cerasicoccus fimbriatus TaxID=3014554 RepID=UPI0022B343F2|nr:hypothetical protein [Cerasicoccus sp. TK19100]
MDFKADILPWINDLAIPISILTATGTYYFRTRAEEKRMAKRVLFYLLELRYSLRISNTPIPQSFLDEFLQIFKDSFREHGIESDEEFDQAFQKISGLINQMLSSIFRQFGMLPEAFQSSFYSALDQLSERDPVAAYKLSGSTNIKILISSLESYQREAESIFEELMFHPAIQEYKVEAHQGNVVQQLDELDDTIRWLAWRCSARTRWHVRKSLQKPNLKINDADRKQIKNQIKLVMPKIIKIAMDIGGQESGDKDVVYKEQ